MKIFNREKAKTIEVTSTVIVNKKDLERQLVRLNRNIARKIALRDTIKKQLKLFK